MKWHMGQSLGGEPFTVLVSDDGLAAQARKCGIYSRGTNLHDVERCLRNYILNP